MTPSSARAEDPLTERSEPATVAGAEADQEDSESETETALERAMDVYRRGSENYQLKRYEQALADFQEASSLYASPDFLYNIGLCYEKLGKRDDAIRSFRTYLRAKPEADDHAEVEARIERLRNEAQAARADEERLRREDEAARAARPAAEMTRDESPTPGPQHPGRALIITGATLTGVGTVLAIVGGVALGVPAAAKSRELADIQTGGNPEGRTFDDARGLDDEGRRLEAGQIALIVTGGALGATGVALLAVGLHRRAAQPSASALRWSPSLSTRGAMINLRGRF